MNSQTLSQSLLLPDNQDLEKQVREAQQITETFLNNNYSQELLEDYQSWSENNNCKSYKFFSQTDDYNPFQDEEEYYYNRFKRCVYQGITNLLDAQFVYLIKNF